MLEPGIRVGESHRTVLLRVTVVLQLLIESRFKTAPTGQIAVTVLQNDALEPAVEHELDPQHERKHHKLSNRGTFPSRPDPTVSCLWIRSGTCVVHSVWRKSGTTRTILHGKTCPERASGFTARLWTAPEVSKCTVLRRLAHLYHLSTDTHYQQHIYKEERKVENPCYHNHAPQRAAAIPAPIACVGGVPKSSGVRGPCKRRL